MAVALSVSIPTIWRDIKFLDGLGIKIKTKDTWTFDNIEMIW